MSTISNELLLERLHWRYATKLFDPARHIPAETWRTLEEVLVLTPSSFGLQPWAFVVVSDAKVRAKLRAESRNQPQITDSSHLVVFAARTSLDEKAIDRHLGRAAEVRGLAPDGLNEQRERLVANLVNGPRSKTIREWAARQAYIALGNFLTAAALLGIDACPMEGVHLSRFDEVLGLTERGLGAVVVGTAGYRSAEDKNARLAKVRFTPEEVILRI